MGCDDIYADKYCLKSLKTSNKKIFPVNLLIILTLVNV